jgi:DNA invertase Pin-like site-specific DNA recombinase
MKTMGGGRRTKQTKTVATPCVESGPKVALGPAPRGRVRGYCRSSQPPKNLRRSPTAVAGAPLGIESQRAAILERFPDAVLHVDAAKSGRAGVARRPGLRQLLADLEPGDVVAVVRLDRLSRDTRLAMALELQIETTCGARLFSLAGEGTSLDGSPDPVAVFNRRIAAAVAELQVAQSSQATAAAFAVKRKQGLSVNGHAPFGYAVEDGGRIVPHDGEQKVLAEVLRFTRGQPATATGAELAARLNVCGFANRDGRPWNRTSAKRLATRLAERTHGLEATA